MSDVKATPKRLHCGGIVVALCLYGSSTYAAETPRPCGPDPRERCIDYHSGQIVSLILTPGATMTIELPVTETVFFVGASDDGIIRGDGASVRTATAGDTTTDPNLMISVPGGAEHPTQFLTLKALHHLEPQPFLVIGRYTDPLTGNQEFRRHVFELQTRPGEPVQEALDTFYSVLFADPVGEKAVRTARWKVEKEQREAQAAADRLKQVSLSTIQRNTAYEGLGTEADRAALAPSAPPGQDAMWDDGQRTFLRYPGNRRVPHAWQILPDGREGVVGQTTMADPSARGNLLIIEQVVPMLRLRDGGAVLCVTNRAYDAAGRNPGTGTVDPGVYRQARGMADAGP
jgi:type IV secretion system protein VirB9